MILSIQAKNFASLKDVTIDFTKTKNSPKNTVFIYGENGSGKSNIIALFNYFNEVFTTLSKRNYLENLISNANDSSIDLDLVKKILKHDLSFYFEQYHMIDCSENTSINYRMLINGKVCDYYVEFSSTRLVRESLQYVLENNSTMVFDITESSINFNPKLFLTNSYKKSFIELVQKYFGKHSFFSILLLELENNNKEFMNMNVHPNLLKVYEDLTDICVSYKNDQYDSRFISSRYFDQDIDEGEVKPSELEYLHSIEAVVSDFFSSIYSDVKKTYYKITKKEDKYEYKLFFSKMIGGQVRDIPFNYESTGTIKLIQLLPMFIEAINGKVVAIDELDSGIHDLLVDSIMKYTLSEIKGQLIITTHNTLLMNSISPLNAYVIDVDAKGNKIIQPLSDYEGRIQKHHNTQSRYLSGLYQGIPSVGYLDMGYIANEVSRGYEESHKEKS